MSQFDFSPMLTRVTPLNYKDLIDGSQNSAVTPVPYKTSQYKSDDSALSKLTPLLSGKYISH